MGFFNFFSGNNKTPHQLLADGKLKPALKGFLDLHKEKPNEPIYMVQIAQIYKKLGHDKEALTYYIKVGDHFVNRGFINKAVASYKKALNINPDDSAVLSKLEDLNNEASRYMFNDSFFKHPDPAEDESLDGFDITEEEITIAEESLKLELEQASSEFHQLTLKNLPSSDEESTNQLSSAPLDAIVESKPAQKASVEEETSQAVFKNRGPNQSEEESLSHSSEGIFHTVEDALDAVFSITPKQNIEKVQSRMHDPNFWPIFSGISKTAFLDIIKALESRNYEEGDYIIHQGEDGSEMFLIIDGKVEVRIHAKGFEKKVAILKSGDFFGEGAVLTKSKRNADIRATEKTEVLALKRTEFIKLVKRHPQILVNMKLPYLTRKKINKKLLEGEGNE
ncbi:MAG: hypothetical protein CSA81_00300 [Acidobacteria bacterium]|nr:MAG: hypothetical protein CSA81_00300 [Acidobacteriota bacterium]